MNNRIENLEWTSLADNIRKGFETGAYAKNCKAVTLISKDGNAARFKSMAEASRFMGKDKRHISTMLKRGIRIFDGYEVILESATA